MFRVCFFFICMLNAFVFAVSSQSCLQCTCGKDILQGKIPLNNARYQTFAYAFNLLCARNASVIVETGTARYGLVHCASDGCSTVLFAEWVKNYGGEFYSVDINANHLQIAANALGDSKSFVNFIHSDSVAFLHNFNRPIDFLYLDSFEYEFGNPGPSQEHHLKEIIAAYPWLTPTSVVMIDDCALPFGGKGKLVIEYLLARGWIILAEGYQVILSQ